MSASCTDSLAAFVKPMGSDGWDSTGAMTSPPAIMPRANPPVKHMPTAPTPGPPQLSWASPANARNQSVTGARRLVANAANSFETQAGAMVRAMARGLGSAPGSPKSTGSTTVQPRSTTRRAKSATAGVMPGISAMTMTAGPSPLRYTVRVVPAWVNAVTVKSTRSSGMGSP